MIKVFLSSTSKDLAPYRERAAKAISEIDGYHCIAMENFGARDSSAEAFCPDKVEECDLFVLLLGPTYGSCPPGSDKSYTHLEYEAAVELDKPRLIFASSKQFNVSQELITSVRPDQFQKQQEFRASINADRIWGEFATPDELDALISRAIQNWKNESGKDTLAKYLAHIIERNTYLNPRGVMQTQRQVSLQLDEVYISLKAERELSRMRFDKQLYLFDQQAHRRGADFGDEEPDEWIGPGGRAAREMLLREPRTEQVELSAAVREHARIVVLGDPGAGKTTLLRFLALQFALAYRDGKSAARDKEGCEYGETRLPIFFRVADYADAFAKDKNLKLCEFLAAPFKNVAPEPAIAALFNDALKRGQAFLMLDGLDEIIDPGDRAMIAGEIEDFVAGLDARNRVIVTSRIAGYREAPLGGAYQHFTLLDLERDQIEKFLHRWCHATERFQTKDASDDEIARNAQREIDGILQAVDENPGVQRLAVNPLLLTILALIHRNGARLPNRRVELYELATKTLLEDWQLARGIPTSKIVKEHEAAQFLWPLAYWLHRERPRGLATEQEIKQQLARFLADKRKLEPDDAEIIEAVNDFLDRVHKRTGVIVERAPRQYGFMHLTFEEYFAARELVRRPDRLARRIYELRHQPRWEEPILLAIGYVSDAYPDLPGELIRTAILAEGDDAHEDGFVPSRYEDVLHRDLLFAAQCIGDCVTIEPGLRRQVVERLVKLYLDSVGPGKYVALRERIARIFNYLKDSEAAIEAADMALAALRDENWAVRLLAARALGDLKVCTPGVVTGLLAALRDGNNNVRRLAAESLGKIRSTPEAVSGLEAALRDENEKVRDSAARALGELKVGVPGVDGALAAAPRNENGNVRKSATGALGKLKVDALEDVSGMLAALRDENRYVRRSAVEALGEMRADMPEAVSGLLAALRDEDEDVRSSAAEALGKIGSEPEVLGSLLTMLRDEKDSARSSAAYALGELKVGAPEVVSALLVALRDGCEDVRSSAVYALGRLKLDTSEIMNALLAALRDECKDVRSSAAYALGELKVSAPEVVNALLVALRDECEDVRSSAAYALGELKLGMPEVVSGLLEALQDEGEDDDVSDSAAEALGKLKVETPEVVGVLWAALQDENYKVRSWAAWVLGGVSKNHKLKLPQDLCLQVADKFQAMLDDPRNQESKNNFFVRERFYFENESTRSFGAIFYSRPVDVIWEALWGLCQWIDEQRG